MWSNEEGTEPQYTFTCDGEGSFRLPSALQLWENQHTVHLAVSNGYTVQVHTLQNAEGCLKDKVVFDSVVSVVKMRLFFAECLFLFFLRLFSSLRNEEHAVLGCSEMQCFFVFFKI